MTIAQSIGAITNGTTQVLLRNMNICAVQAQTLAGALKGCKNLTKLDLDYNKIGTEGAKAIAIALEGCKSLTDLELYQNNVGEEGIKAVANALKDRDNLTILSIADNNIGSEGAKAVAEVLKGCKNLTQLYIGDNNIGTEGAKAVANALEGCENLTIVNLSQNNIDSEGAKAVAKALKGCKDLTQLYIGVNNIGTEGAKAVANALEGCENLTIVNLSQNNIDSEGAKAVAKALKGCKDLTQLYIGENNIGTEGAKAVANALEGCENLTIVNLHQNNIGSEGAKAVAEVLKGCKNLTQLYIGVNNIGTEGAKAVANALEGCENLTIMGLKQNNIGSEGAKAVAKALKGCKNLTQLDLQLNNIGIDGAKAIAKSLHKTCPSAKTWCEFGHGITPKELFAKVCTPGEDITAPDPDSCVSVDEANEPCAEPKSSEDAVEPPDMGGVSFADVVQLAKEVSHTRAGLGVAREDSLQTAIALFEEFAGPVIQGHFVQLKLKQTSSDITNSKERLESCQTRIRASSPAGLSQLIAERNDERARLRSLVQNVYPWVRTGIYASNEVQVRGFKERLASLLQGLSISGAALVGRACAANFKDCQELLGRADKCVKEYKASQSSHQNNVKQRSEEAVEKVILRVSELGLGDAFRVAMREPENATRLKPELSELQNALQEELEDLKGDTFRGTVTEVLCAISSVFDGLENSTQDFKVDEPITLSPEDIAELYDYVLLSLKETNVSCVKELYEKLGRSRNATESLERAKRDLEVEDLEEDDKAYLERKIRKQELILSEGSPIELSKTFRHKLAETLQHAQEHYPELLKNQAWLEKVHVSADGVLEVACSDLWLANVEMSDFQPVGELLASRGGKIVQKVLDSTGRSLVLKQFQLGHPSQIRAFYTQVANLGKVASHHLIRIIGAFVSIVHGVPRGCIVMPFYEQGNLAEWIEKHPNADKATRNRLASGLLIGVADMHALNIVHCDIKPENIFLTSMETPLLGDFDGMKVADSTATYTSLQATPQYLAPELQTGLVDRFETAMDMYSVGVVLEELYPRERTSAMQTLINSLKAINPEQRPSAVEALQHEAFGVAADPLVKCPLCLDDMPLSEGTCCERGHFLCRDCIARSVKSATDPEASVTVDADGTMECVEAGCNGRIMGQDIMRLAPRALRHLLRIAQMKAESEAVVRAEEEIKKRMAVVLEEGGLSLEAKMHLQHIEERLLITSCPNCNARFDEFEGCCAVICGNASCRHRFCAWCLEYSSEDKEACYAHVRTCCRKLSDDLYYPDFPEQVYEAWRVIRTERLRMYWSDNIQGRSLPSVLRAQLEPLLTPDIVGTEFELE